MTPRTVVLGTGHYVPSRVVTNQELTDLMDTTHEWIVERTGIETRRFAVPGVDTTSSMGTAAALKALEAAGLGPEDLAQIS